MESKIDKKHARHGKDDGKLADLQGESAAGAAAMTPEQFEQLKEQAAKADEFRDRMLREAADFENYRKRAARERQDAVTYANENLLQKLIPILDTFEMALAASANDGASAQSLQTGVRRWSITSLSRR